MAEECAQPGCDRPRKAKGFCPAHYERQKRGATPEQMAAPIHVRPDCSQPGCGRKHYARGLCKAHFHRLQKGATAEQLAPPIAPRVGKGESIITCGHPDRRYGAKGLCHPCYVNQWIKAHPDANSGNGWSRRNPEGARRNQRRAVLKKRGTTPEEYDRLWKAQEGKCANPGCRAVYPLVMDDYRQGFHADHCHKTGRVRGLLCPGCNVALGQVGESPERLIGLVKYLEMYGFN